MKKYFTYELKRVLPAIGYITLGAVIVYALPLLLYSVERFRYGTPLGIISTIGGLLAAVTPIWMLGYKMKKRSVDMFYALPLSHTKIMAAKFLVGLLAVFIPYTAAYWLGTFVAMAKSYAISNIVWYVPQFFGSLIPVYMLYAMAAFVYTRANKVVDGIAFLFFWTFALALVAEVIFKFFPSEIISNYSYTFLPYQPLNRLTICMDYRITGSDYYSEPDGSETVTMAIAFALNALLSVGATVGLIMTEKRGKAENAGQISEDWFGYKVMLPLYTVCLPVMLDVFNLGNLIIIVIFEVALFALTVLYKRTFKIGKIQAIIFSATAVGGIILAVITSIITNII